LSGFCEVFGILGFEENFFVSLGKFNHELLRSSLRGPGGRISGKEVAKEVIGGLKVSVDRALI
jgi:hypothetical protein